MAKTDYLLFRRGVIRTLTEEDGRRPPAGVEDVLALPDGRAVVLYETEGSSGFPRFDPVPGSDRVFLQAFGPDGASLTGRIDVPADDEGRALNPQARVLSDGTILVAWEVRADETGGDDAVRLRRFSAELEPIGEVFEPFAGVLETPRYVQVTADPSGGVVVIAREGGEAGAAYARLGADLSVTERGATDFDWDGEPVGAAIGAGGALVMMSEADGRMTVWPSGAALAYQGERTYDGQLDALPQGGFVATYIDVNADGYENARVVLLDADGIPADEGVLLAASNPNQVFQIPDHATRDVNVDVLPSGHVVVVHLASFTLTSGDLPVINVFAPDGERLMRDLVLGDVGTYFEVAAGVADGALTLSYFDSDAGAVTMQTIDLVRRTTADAGGEAIRGDALIDDVFGGDGDDTVHGEGGDDLLIGAGGADVLFGGDGADLIYGDAAVG